MIGIGTLLCRVYRTPGFPCLSMCGKLAVPSQEAEQAMHDIVIRGGKIVDGTGAPAFEGDVAIEGDRIVQVGGKAGPGRREVKAEGRLVTPGWVDVHTHYDGQATWDPVLAPSSWHGATTIVFGNCGVGFAPVRRKHHQALIDLMEGIDSHHHVGVPEPKNTKTIRSQDLVRLGRVRRHVELVHLVDEHLHE